MARRRDLAARCARGLTEALAQGGRREDRVRAAPAVSCAMCTKKCAHEHTGPAESIRPSLRNGLTAYAELSPETNSSCLRHRRIDGFARPGWACENLRRFDTSHGCQDHTVLPYAASFTKPSDQPLCDQPKFWQRRFSAVRLHAVDRSRITALRTCLRAQRCRVHRTPSQRFVTIAIRPSFKGMRCASYGGDLGETGRGIFLGEGTGRVKSD